MPGSAPYTDVLGAHHRVLWLVGYLEVEVGGELRKGILGSAYPDEVFIFPGALRIDGLQLGRDEAEDLLRVNPIRARVPLYVGPPVAAAHANPDSGARPM